MLSILEADGPGVFPYALFTVDASDLDTAAGDSITFSLTGSTVRTTSYSCIKLVYIQDIYNYVFRVK